MEKMEGKVDMNTTTLDDAIELAKGAKQRYNNIMALSKFRGKHDCKSFNTVTKSQKKGGNNNNKKKSQHDTGILL